jgi:hypothetical protein
VTQSPGGGAIDSLVSASGPDELVDIDSWSVVATLVIPINLPASLVSECHQSG